MKKLLLLIGAVLVVFAYFSFSGQNSPYSRLSEIENKYGVSDSMMPTTEESTQMLKVELSSLKKSLQNDSSRDAEAATVLVNIRLDLAEAALRLYAAKKNMGAMSPFSNNCLPGKPAFEAGKLLDESVAKAKNASDRMKIFLGTYSAEAGKFGTTNNYAKGYSDALEESALIDKRSLEIFC